MGSWQSPWVPVGTGSHERRETWGQDQEYPRPPPRLESVCRQSGSCRAPKVAEYVRFGATSGTGQGERIQNMADGHTGPGLLWGLVWKSHQEPDPHRPNS